MANRMKSHLVEAVLFSLLIVFIVPAAYVLYQIMKFGITYVNALFLSLIIIIMTIFLQTIMMIRIYQKYE
jgi:hypothetical protein